MVDAVESLCPPVLLCNSRIESPDSLCPVNHCTVVVVAVYVYTL